MSEREIILRKWSGRIRTADAQEYLDYVVRTGADDYRSTPGNLGHQILLRALDDGTSEVTTLSWWRDMEAIKAFAGPEPELARYYPEDERFLLDHPKFVEHHRVIAGELRL
jgi:heme-degrading monooxygenase HmoA